MEWNELYGAGSQPDMEKISRFIQNSLWDELNSYMEVQYEILPKIEYSCCSAKRGWNVKYKKGSRALCTLYPDEGYFTCLVSIGNRERAEAEFLLTACTDYVKDLYHATSLFHGGKWLMIEVTNKEILEDVKELIGTRVKKGKKGQV